MNPPARLAVTVNEPSSFAVFTAEKSGQIGHSPRFGSIISGISGSSACVILSPVVSGMLTGDVAGKSCE